MNKLIIFAIIINILSVIVSALQGAVSTAYAHIQCLLWLDIIRKDNKLIDKMMENIKKGK